MIFLEIFLVEERHHVVVDEIFGEGFGIKLCNLVQSFSFVFEVLTLLNGLGNFFVHIVESKVL